MTEVIGIKFEETGTIEYVVPDRNYAKDDFVVVLDKKDKRLAQVVMENTNFPEVSLPTDLNRVEGLAGERDFARYDENLLKAEKSMGVVADLIAQNQLEMKVVDIVFPLNCSYVLISFVARKTGRFFVSYSKIWLLTLRHVLSCAKFQVVRNQRFMVA